MGGDAQPQILLQLAARLFAAGTGVADAIAAGRWALRGAGTGFDTWTSGGPPAVAIEAQAPEAWRGGLAARGHVVADAPAFDSGFGHAHAIVVEPSGSFAAVGRPPRPRRQRGRSLMPEGHTLHRLAHAHRARFAGHQVAVSSPQGRFADAALVDGRVLDEVTAHGKHLFAAFGDRIVHVHLGLFGKVQEGDGPPPPPVGEVRMRWVAETGGATCAARRRARC